MDVFNIIVLLFFMYSFIGWLWETVYCSLKAGHFVYRGFLIGPITPIYGFDILGVVYLLQPIHGNTLLLFFAAAILVTILEYATSYLLEKFFHASWWDYKDVWLNINGRVALPISVFWGLCCVLIVKFVHPWLLDIASKVSHEAGFLLPVTLLMIVSFDLGMTIANMATFQQAVKRVEKELNHQKAAVSQYKEVINEKRSSWQEQLQKLPAEWHELKATFPKLNFQQRRLLKNFQRLKMDNITNLQEIKSFLEELRRK
ncbi:putative ABC transporter permease [Enterococcus casseliflavus]|uniref:putative ABC transporter permease n=1 Tax=Enterococcus casseliflavus TaxID=37734 RepID=UPI002955BB4D|nr:hypothetical protein [Enterococcus casseliflavus]MDV7751314.1 hypothetical protein [Enterococcus casseliflavus]